MIRAGIEELLKELVQAEKQGERIIPMMPLFDMYENTDYRTFINKARDYIWFDDYEKTSN